MSERSRRDGRRRLGCVVATAAGGALLVAAAVVIAIALAQTRSASPALRAVEHPVPATRPTRVTLDVAVARVVVEPADPGAPLAVAARYDPDLYRLDAGPSPDGGTFRIAFRPDGSEILALLRVKLGADPPLLRVALPRDAVLELAGTIEAGFGALELGGSRVRAADLAVSGGALTLSFARPLAAPMERLVVRGDHGSVEVTGLGNASPRRFTLRHHLGAVDLDLRGAWATDSDLSIRTGLAGGSVWLPRDVTIEGLDADPTAPSGADAPEVGRPRLRFEVTTHAGRLAFVK